MNTDWIPPVNLSIKSKVEDLKFIFSQAKDRLKELADEGDRLYTKSMTFVSISITFLLAAGGYLFSLKNIRPEMFSCLSVIITFWVIVSILKDNVFPTSYSVPGTSPEKLFVDKLFETQKGYEDKTTEWHLIYNEIVSFQKRINNNKAVNNERKYRLNRAYKLVYKAPFFFLLTYIVSSIIFLAFHL